MTQEIDENGAKSWIDRLRGTRDSMLTQDTVYAVSGRSVGRIAKRFRV